jgi:hypothetical protein
MAAVVARACVDHRVSQCAVLQPRVEAEGMDEILVGTERGTHLRSRLQHQCIAGGSELFAREPDLRPQRPPEVHVLGAPDLIEIVCLDIAVFDELDADPWIGQRAILW